MTISREDLDKLTARCKTTSDVDALYSMMLQHMINRSLEGEMNAHLGYGSGQKIETGNRRSNTRNGSTKKAIKGTFGELEIETPRDRESSF